MESLGFSVVYQVILDEVLLLPFQFRVLLFFSLVWLLWLGVPVLCWIKVMRVGFLVLLLNEEIFSFLCMILGVGFYLYYADICSIYIFFVEGFHQKWMLNFIKCFSCLYWEQLDFYLHFIKVFYHIDWFAVIKPSLHLWDKPHLIMVYDF